MPTRLEAFGQDFFRWYNHEHRHSGLSFLTPAVVHRFANVAQAASMVNFIATDDPGPWFECIGNGCVQAGD